MSPQREIEEELARRLDLWQLSDAAHALPVAPEFLDSWAETGRVIDAMLKRGHEFHLERFLDCMGCGWIAYFEPLAPWKPQWPRTVIMDPEATAPLAVATAALVALRAME